MIIVDTNVLIDLDLYVFNEDLLYAASILSRAELEFGVQAAPTPTEHAYRTHRLSELDAQFDWLPFDVASTRSYGEVAAGATATGARVRSKDSLIAAQARRYGAAVLTRNVPDFELFLRFVDVIDAATYLKQ